VKRREVNSFFHKKRKKEFVVRVWSSWVGDRRLEIWKREEVKGRKQGGGVRSNPK
jgi:hypothetical protein